MDKITKLPTSISLKEVVDDPNRFILGWDLCLTHMICGQHEGENCVGICVYEDQTIENLKSSHEGLVNALEKGRLLAKEAGGFIRCHELALSGDGGNSNMAVMEIRIKEFEEALKAADGGVK